MLKQFNYMPDNNTATTDGDKTSLTKQFILYVYVKMLMVKCPHEWRNAEVNVNNCK